jgi:hypothetical protein
LILLCLEQLAVSDSTSDLMAMLDQKAQEQTEQNLSSPGTSHRLLDLFKQPTLDELVVAEDVSDWESGKPVIRGFSVKEDMNKKGMRKSKKGNHFGTGSGMQMEVKSYRCGQK